MKDNRLKEALRTQQDKQKGAAATRYFELLKQTIELVKAYRCFIADMHLQRLEKSFVGIDRLSEALNALEDAQLAVELHMERSSGSGPESLI